MLVSPYYRRKERERKREIALTQRVRELSKRTRKEVAHYIEMEEYHAILPIGMPLFGQWKIIDLLIDVAQEKAIYVITSPFMTIISIDTF